MASPVNPKPAGKSSPYWWDDPRSCGIPTNPAMAPDITIVMKIMRLELTPLTAAARNESPLARSSNPKRVRLEENPEGYPHHHGHEGEPEHFSALEIDAG